MIDKIALEEFKTGLELEQEFNRIVKSALSYEMSHLEAEQILVGICEYGVESGIFPEADYQYYVRRKNFRNF